MTNVQKWLEQWRPKHGPTRPCIRLADGWAVVAVASFFLTTHIAAYFFNTSGAGPAGLTPIGFTMVVLFSLLWGVPAVLVLARRGATLADAFGIRRETAWRDIRVGLRCGVVMVALVFFTSYLTQVAFRVFNLPAKSQDILLQLADPETSFALRLVFAMFAFTLVPVVEEAAFRGVLIPAFSRVEPWPSLVVWQAVYFSLIHCNAAAAPALFVTGVCLALGQARTGSLLTPITMHALLNLVSVSMSLAG